MSVLPFYYAVEEPKVLFKRRLNYNNRHQSGDRDKIKMGAIIVITGSKIPAPSILLVDRFTRQDWR